MEYKWLLQENIELYMEPRSSNDYSKAFSFQFPNNLTLEVAVLTDSGLILFNISDGEKQHNFGEVQEWIIYLKLVRLY